MSPDLKTLKNMQFYNSNLFQTCQITKCETCLVWTLALLMLMLTRTTQQLEVIHDLAAKMAGKLDEY